MTGLSSIVSISAPPRIQPILLSKHYCHPLFQPTANAPGVTHIKATTNASTKSLRAMTMTTTTMMMMTMGGWWQVISLKVVSPSVVLCALSDLACQCLLFTFYLFDLHFHSSEPKTRKISNANSASPKPFRITSVCFVWLLTWLSGSQWLFGYGNLRHPFGKWWVSD